MIKTKIAAALLATAASVSLAAPAEAAPPWSGAWARAQQVAAPESWAGPNWSLTGFADQTLRQELRLTEGGSRLRIELSNVYGDRPLKVAGATVGLAGPGGSVVPGTVRTLTFGGRSSVAVAAGRELMSDAANLRTAALDRISVTLYFKEATGPATFHEAASDLAYVAGGDRRYSTKSLGTQTSHSSYFLSGAEVSGHGPRRQSIVTFGDSITDGVGSAQGADNRYPDKLAERLGGRYGVLNAGISGNQVLADSPLYGESGLHRFERDALGQPGVRTVVLLEGVNDIGMSGWTGTPVTAEALIAGYRTLIAAAHERGVRIVGGTVTPFKGSYYDTPANEAVRDAVNAWIRGSGEFDAVADFDLAVSDPADRDRMLPLYSAGSDGLHPNDAGLAAMARAIPLSIL
ncbi:SGNH hydrolase [Actinorhabdospora filicis]|uniref:SGNH hydrolase n=1 Tax=Actinorhabdospora filicis TaxID=1785913 RepID=A0A9W6W885_9ACTN|nr:SGNH/GDSL hydrolase family protein [Actinorhabdospora filicis]GLZ76718.1 SGNH hydrolase [Actinorhabdospora filicis]